MRTRTLTSRTLTSRTGSPTGTRRPRAAATFAAVGLALGLGLAACGGDDDAPDATDDPPATAPTDDIDVGEFDETLIVGLPVDEAQAIVEDEGWVFRIAVIDGEDQVLTMDFVENRVNVAVDDGIVTGVEFIG